MDSRRQSCRAHGHRLASARPARRRREAARRGDPRADPRSRPPAWPLADPGPDAGATATRFLLHPLLRLKTLNADRIALDFKNIVEEVIAHLRADPGANLTVRLEIEATDTTGFEEGKVRTVSENARTLKFDQSGFEES